MKTGKVTAAFVTTAFGLLLLAAVQGHDASDSLAEKSDVIANCKKTGEEEGRSSDCKTEESLENEEKTAPICDPLKCDAAPDCFCSVDGRRVPGGLRPEETPQMVMLTFDDAVHDGIDEEFAKILDPKFTNPNGCSVKGTFFVSHQHTDYSMVNRVYRSGHEVASHSITHTDNETYWRGLSEAQWSDEMIGQKRLLAKFANIPEAEIVGMRVPNLAHGGDDMFRMMATSGNDDTGILYDSSVSAEYRKSEAIWPYTLDYRINHPCFSDHQVCPSQSFPGVWEIPINQMDDFITARAVRNLTTGKIESYKFREQVFPGCGMIDGCHRAVQDPDRMLRILLQDFYRRYYTNRAPMGVFLHAATFRSHPRLEAPVQRFIRTLLSLPDVYLVRMRDVIEWIRTPTPIGPELDEFEPWKVACNGLDEPKESNKNGCTLRQCYFPKNQRLRVDTCNLCPKEAPTTDNWFEV